MSLAQKQVVSKEKGLLPEICFSEEKKADFIETLQGEVNMYSRDGTIRKMGPPGKGFSLLNLYDLFRGKVRFTRGRPKMREDGRLIQR